jgi:CspA family cold shock protein
MSAPEDTLSPQPETENIVLPEVRDKEEIGSNIGTCKWFNDKLGFGFITICDGNEKGKDIFVHHSGIRPLNSNYRTLKKGEYINFNIITGLNGLQAVDVTGINGGPLMCDHVIGKKITPIQASMPGGQPIIPGQMMQGQIPLPGPFPGPPQMPYQQNRRPFNPNHQQWQVVSRKPIINKYNKNSVEEQDTREQRQDTREQRPDIRPDTRGKRYPPNNRPYKHVKNAEV